ncbi:MAG: hypothetical protein ABIZ04_08125 [Opitutus sp.]
MFHLANAELSVDLVDPAREQTLLGTRFCTGGFVWQVTDAAVGPLLTGPQWPNPSPDPFDSQGLPESFRHRTRDGRPLTWHGPRGVALGIGELETDASGAVKVVAPCEWTVARRDAQVRFETRQNAAGFVYELVRTITLDGRALTSTSTLTNHGEAPLLLEWFAHPFFALNNGRATVTVPAESRLADNPGFLLSGNVLTQKRRFEHYKDGHMDFLHLPPKLSPTFRVDHPALQSITLTASFAPSECLIWGNNVTFSIEPYQTLILAPGETREWNLRYDFGDVSKMVSPSASVRTPERE